MVRLWEVVPYAEKDNPFAKPLFSGLKRSCLEFIAKEFGILKGNLQSRMDRISDEEFVYYSAPKVKWGTEEVRKLLLRPHKSERVARQKIF